jgi:hypothetical protein
MNEDVQPQQLKKTRSRARKTPTINGEDRLKGPGEQIVDAALAAIMAVSPGTTSDQIAAIVHDAVMAGGEAIERDMIWHTARKSLSTLGITRDAFGKLWSRCTDELRHEQREAREDARRDAQAHGRDGDDEPTPEDKARLRTELYPRIQYLLEDADILSALADTIENSASSECGIAARFCISLSYPHYSHNRSRSTSTARPPVARPSW